MLIRHYSPLRYPGGKGRLSGFVQRILEENRLLDGHYVEPYAGGAAVALSLLLMEYASVVHINDINRPVCAFWKAVLDETDPLCKMIRDKKVTAAQWKLQRDIMRDFRNHSRLEVAFSLFFLNRTNRSGIVHTGGMIGGCDQTGEWKLDARYNKQELIGRIEAIAKYSNRIRVTNKDAEDFLSETVPSLPSKTLIFLDPPYFERGSSLYENHYRPEDHARLATMVRSKLRCNWMISYDNHPEIRDLYRGSRRLKYSLSYTAARRYEGSEVMFFSDGLIVPRVRSPLQPWALVSGR
jgi:DNA adenine methylase